MKKISVIIPTYRPQNYLYNCLKSLESQTMPSGDFEILVILNGERFPYENFIQSIIESLSSNNVCLRYSEKAGVSNARNIGLDYAEGEYITFIDDDDYVSETYLEELYSKSNEETIGLAYPYAFNDGAVETQLKYSITEEYSRYHQYGHQSYLKTRKFFSGPCMKLINTKIIGNRRFDVRYKNGEDSIYMFLISDKFRYVNFTSSKAIYYRRYRKGSAVKSKQSVAYWIRNSLMMTRSYISIFIAGFPCYNFYFFVTRILGVYHQLLVSVLK